MTAHELARALLALPDKPVVLHSTSDWSAEITDAADTSTAVILLWVPQ